MFSNLALKYVIRKIHIDIAIAKFIQLGNAVAGSISGVKERT